MKTKHHAHKVKDLFQAAKKVRMKAHAPYSKFKVGAAILDEKGRIHVGCNVENSSYGGTICAERAAITAMVAAGGTQVRDIVVVTDTPNGCPPCGFCRQVLLEFESKSLEHPTMVHISHTRAIRDSVPLKVLLPYGFDESYLDR